jgi:hypothetical protein|tara:strand:- start:229 stop:375 length:147 start_codon:yes stop_codon:yes gene_type:complete
LYEPPNLGCVRDVSRHLAFLLLVVPTGVPAPFGFTDKVAVDQYRVQEA